MVVLNCCKAHQSASRTLHKCRPFYLPLLGSAAWFPPNLSLQAPLSQTLQRVHVAFECLLDIIALQQQLAREQPALARRLAAGAGQPGGQVASTDGPAVANEQEDEQADAVLLRIARDLLALGKPSGLAGGGSSLCSMRAAIVDILPVHSPKVCRRDLYHVIRAFHGPDKRLE